MKLTTKSEYSLLALLYIARHQDRGFVKIENICEAYDIPRKYLEQLMLVLKQSGLVKSRRGARGGSVLARPARKITAAEVIRLMDGPLAPIESVSKYFFFPTPLDREKKLIRVFKEIRNYISGKLERLTLADLL